MKKGLHVGKEMKVVDALILATFLESSCNKEAMIQMRIENCGEARETAEEIVEAGLGDPLIIAYISEILEADNSDQRIRHCIETVVVDQMSKANSQGFLADRLGAFEFIKPIKGR